VIELRVVGSSDDQTQLLLSDSARGRRGKFAVAIDRELLSVLQAAVYARRDGTRREALEDAPDSAPTAFPGPKVAPREIQRLLRAGMSVERVAEVLDCDEDLVERFLTPILYERSGVIKDVQRLSIEKSRLGTSGLPVFEAIEVNLAARRIRLTEEQYFDSWDATREEGQPWKLTFEFDFRGRQVARFEYDPRTGEVEATNKVALDLAWVPQGTEKANIPPPMPAAAKRRASGKKTSARKPVARKPAARKPAARKATTRKPAARKTTARKPAARKTTARKPAARKPAARKATTRKPAARKTTARKPAARKTTARKPAARKTTARKPAARKTTARGRR
jgi:hypothetical protein